MRNLSRTILGLVIGFALIFTTSAPPTAALAKGSLVVDNVGTCHSATAFTTISDALAVAQPGNTIRVCPGVYSEALVIDHLDRLKLIAKTGVVLEAPANHSGAIVYVTNSAKIKIQGFVIDGAEQFDPAATGIAGIVMVNSSGTIQKNTVTRIRENPLGSDGTLGQAILINNASGPVKITKNTVSDFQASGIEVDNAFKPAIVNNKIASSGTGGSEPFNILLTHTVGAAVTSNTITSDWTPGSPNDTDGIYMSSVRGTKVSGNRIYGNEWGIELYESCDVFGQVSTLNRIAGNKIYGSGWGILVVSYIGTATTCDPTVTKNKVSGNKVYAPASLDPNFAGLLLHVDPDDGTYFPAFFDNTVKGNSVFGYGARDGVLEGVSGSNNKLTPNKFMAPAPAVHNPVLDAHLAKLAPRLAH